ncbi:MAG: GGDEF domain-containing protein [Thermomonas sp.]|nr:GGDEF domain-containing protein [Thermomonas sp.]
MAVPLQVQLIEAFGAGVYALTLASHADLWWRRREQRSHALLALSAFGALLVNLTGAAIRVAPAAYATALLGLNMLGVAVALISLYELAEAIGGKRPGRLARAMEAATLVPILLLPVLPHAVLLAALYLTGVLFLLAAMFRAARHARSGDPESHVIALGLTFLFTTLLYDILSEMQVLVRVEGMPVLGFTVLYLAAARALSLRYEREHRELLELRGKLETRVQQRTTELEAANQRLEQLSRTDALTGLANRRCFVEAAAAHLRASPARLLMIDIDHFKRINDTHGHETGDAALRAVADALGQGLRSGELLARWGGEEFIALLEDADDASARAERMRAAVAATCVQSGDAALRLSASFGLARVARGGALDAAIARADEALYRAKREGRDRVVTDTAGSDAG